MTLELPLLGDSIGSTNTKQNSWQKLITAFLVALFLLNIYLLWTARGENVVGWELLGPAEGALNIYEDGLWEAIKQNWYYTRHFQYWAGISSVLGSVLPGYFHVVWPWLLWSQLLMLLITIAAIVFGAWGIRAHGPVMIAACVASGTLATCSILGSPLATVYVTYVLAIVIALRRAKTESSVRHLLLDLVLWGLLFELCFHTYEPGRVACVIPLIAAFAIRGMTWQRRVLWATLSVAMLYQIFFAFNSSFNSTLLLADIPLTVNAIPSAVKHVLLTLFTTARLDFPFVSIAAVLSLVVIKQHRGFWTLVLLLQFVMLTALALLGVLDGRGDEVLRARRYGATPVVLAMVLGYAWNHGLHDHRHLRKLVVALLGVGMAAVLHGSIKFYQAPSQTYSLPFTESAADFRINPKLNEDAARVAKFAADVNTPMFLLYGYGNYAENTTDPEAFPERLVLYLGPERFLQQFVFISNAGSCRYACVPMTSAERARELIGERGGRAYFFLPHASLPGASVDYQQGGLLPQLVSPEGAPLPGTSLAEDFRYYGAKQVDLNLSYFRVYLLGD